MVAGRLRKTGESGRHDGAILQVVELNHVGDRADRGELHERGDDVVAPWMFREHRLGNLERQAARREIVVRILAVVLFRAENRQRPRRHVLAGRQVVVTDDDVDAEVRGAVHRCVIANADVARHDDRGAVAGRLFGCGDAEAVAFIEAARNVVTDAIAGAEQPERVLEDDRRRRPVDVIVRDDANPLPIGDGPPEPLDGAIHPEHREGVVQVPVERRVEELGGVRYVGNATGEEDPRDGRRNVEVTGEAKDVALVDLGEFPVGVAEGGHAWSGGQCLSVSVSLCLRVSVCEASERLRTQ